MHSTVSGSETGHATPMLVARLGNLSPNPTAIPCTGPFGTSGERCSGTEPAFRPDNVRHIWPFPAHEGSMRVVEVKLAPRDFLGLSTTVSAASSQAKFSGRLESPSSRASSNRTISHGSENAR